MDVHYQFYNGFILGLTMLYIDENAVEKFFKACEESNKELVEELVESDESIIDATSGNVRSRLCPIL